MPYGNGQALLQTACVPSHTLMPPLLCLFVASNCTAMKSGLQRKNGKKMTDKRLLFVGAIVAVLIAGVVLYEVNSCKNESYLLSEDEVFLMDFVQCESNAARRKMIDEYFRKSE